MSPVVSALTVGFGVLAVLTAVAAAVALRRRRRRLRRAQTGWLTDEMVREIIARGHIESELTPEPPLDWEEIRREEERFWTDPWDRPEPYAE